MMAKHHQRDQTRTYRCSNHLEVVRHWTALSQWERGRFSVAVLLNSKCLRPSDQLAMWPPFKQPHHWSCVHNSRWIWDTLSNNVTILIYCITQQFWTASTFKPLQVKWGNWEPPQILRDIFETPLRIRFTSLSPHSETLQLQAAPGWPRPSTSEPGLPTLRKLISAIYTQNQIF